MRASVIGATGFAGAELLRLLDGHPLRICAGALTKSWYP